MEQQHTRTVRRLIVIRSRVIHHLAKHRLEWFAGLGTTFFILGWITHREAFNHFAEFTGVPVLEAFLNRGQE